MTSYLDGSCGRLVEDVVVGGAVRAVDALVHELGHLVDARLLLRLALAASRAALRVILHALAHHKHVTLRLFLLAARRFLFRSLSLFLFLLRAKLLLLNRYKNNVSRDGLPA